MKARKIRNCRVRGGFWVRFKSYLDRLGENRVLCAFVDKGFDTYTAIDKGLAFEVQAYRYSGLDGLNR
jgi:hypothetical protein